MIPSLLSSPSRYKVIDKTLVSGGHFGFHASVTLCHGFSKTPPGLLKDMVCKIQINRKTAFTSKFVRAYMPEPGLSRCIHDFDVTLGTDAVSVRPLKI